uniref:Uncharacterized protein n=1 Tax=Schistocephalus solidus TaxID=70667 RepID=A0A0V0J877_SCHSO
MRATRQEVIPHPSDMACCEINSFWSPTSKLWLSIQRRYLQARLDTDQIAYRHAGVGSIHVSPHPPPLTGTPRNTEGFVLNSREARVNVRVTNKAKRQVTVWVGERRRK